MERQRGESAKSTVKTKDVSFTILNQQGFTYMEVAVVLMVLVILLPVLFNFQYGIEKNIKSAFYHQQLQGESTLLMAALREELRQGKNFRFSREGNLLFDLSTGDTITYFEQKRRFIRAVRLKGGKQFQGWTILAHNVYLVLFQPQEKGVWIEVGFQNWFGMYKWRRYFHGRVAS